MKAKKVTKQRRKTKRRKDAQKVAAAKWRSARSKNRYENHREFSNHLQQEVSMAAVAALGADFLRGRVVAPVVTPHSDFFRANVTHVESPEDLPHSERASGGFGSTGLK